MSLEVIAEYVGTSVAIIEHSHGRYIRLRAASLMPAAGALDDQPGNSSARTLARRRPPSRPRLTKVVPGGIEPPFAT